jgi:putative ABC transport system permease protein
VNDFVLIRKNLFRKKLRAGLMIVSIIVAFAIFGVLAAFERAFDAGEDVAHADRLVVVNKINFTQPLPVAYANRIRGIDGVANLTHANWFGGYFQDPKNFLIVFAVEPETYMDLYSDDLDFPAEARRAFVRDRSGPWSARRWRANGDGRSATTFRSPARSSRRRTAPAPGTSPSTASSPAARCTSTPTS